MHSKVHRRALHIISYVHGQVSWKSKTMELLRTLIAGTLRSASMMSTYPMSEAIFVVATETVSFTVLLTVFNSELNSCIRRRIAAGVSFLSGKDVRMDASLSLCLLRVHIWKHVTMIGLCDVTYASQAVKRSHTLQF